MSISKNSVSSTAVSSAASSQPAPQQASQPAPHQASPEQVEQVIASALPLTGMIRERAASQRRCALPV